MESRGFSPLLKLSLAIVIGTYVVNFAVFGDRIGPFDYDHLSSYYELAWRYWISSPGVPQYNPYFCGGRTLGGDPQVPLFHPGVLLVPLLGPTRVIKLELLMQLALGVYGLLGMFRHFGLHTLQMLWGTFLFIAGGAVISRFMVGHVTLGFYALMPLFFYLSYELERKSLRFGRTLTGYLVLFSYCGLYKPNFIIHAIPLMLCEHIFRAWLKRNPRILVYFFVGLGFCLVSNAPTYLPAWRYFTDFPRTLDAEYKLVPWYSLAAGLLLPLKAIPKALYGSPFMQRHEYSVFLGPVALLFAWGGFKKARAMFRAEAFSLLSLVAFAALLGLGSESASISVFHPYTWLGPVWPGFESIRVPVRFWFGTYFSLVVFSAVGFRDSANAWLKALLFALGILPLLFSSVVNLSKTAWLADVSQESVPRENRSLLTWERGKRTSMYSPIRRGVGILDCVDNIENYRSADLKEGPYLVPREGVATRWLSWHEIALKATGPKSFSVQFNLTHSKYWRFEGEGGWLTSKDGELLTVTSIGKSIDGRVEFRQPFAREGFFSMVAAWALLCIFVVRRVLG